MWDDVIEILALIIAAAIFLLILDSILPIELVISHCECCGGGS